MGHILHVYVLCYVYCVTEYVIEADAAGNERVYDDVAIIITTAYVFILCWSLKYS